MPALTSSTLPNHLVNHNVSIAASNATTADFLQVVCAWPVSGQYGPGSRVLYYVLIAACVFARKADWLRNACLAAALLFPAVAALHGIVLASIHIPGAVDMDIYGAFQLCSIGILAAPVTVKLSRTYFYDPGRNTIFVWTALILAGLLSLTVEFFRISTSPCPHDDAGNPVSLDPEKFTYDTTCGLVCSTTDGPTSPLRRGSANNIYVIPAPDKLTFDTTTLLAAACSIPAILSLVSMWNKILEINWKARFGNKNDDKRIDEPIEGTNGATLKKMKGVNSIMRLFLSAVEIPVFGAAVLAILIYGERNFFSHQVRYQTEPIASIGQWAPIAGTVLAVLGSLYILLAADLEEGNVQATYRASHQRGNPPTEEAGLGLNLFNASSHSVVSPAVAHVHRGNSDADGGAIYEIVPTTTHRGSSPTPIKRSWTINGNTGKRREVAKALTAIGNYLGTASRGTFDDSEFRRGEAQDFPEIPGEEHRNRELRRIREQYNQYRNADGDITPRPASRVSFAGSVASAAHAASSITPRESSPSSTSPRRPHVITLLDDRASFDLQDPTLSATSTAVRPRQRRDTLEVPSQVHHRSNSSTSIANSTVTTHEGLNSPSIVVSSDPIPSHPIGVAVVPLCSPTTSAELPPSL